MPLEDTLVHPPACVSHTALTVMHRWTRNPLLLMVPCGISSFTNHGHAILHTHLCSPSCRAWPHSQMRCRTHEYALHTSLLPYPVSVVCKIIVSIHPIFHKFLTTQPFWGQSYSKTALGLSETYRFSCFQVRCKCRISEHKTHRLCLNTGRESLSDGHNHPRTIVR